MKTKTNVELPYNVLEDILPDDRINRGEGVVEQDDAPLAPRCRGCELGGVDCAR